MSNVPATPSAATPADVERRLHETVRRLGGGRVAVLRFGGCGGTLRTSDGRTFPVRSYADAQAIAYVLDLSITRTERKVAS